MATYEVELLGRKFEVDASSQAKALGMARLHVAKLTMNERSQAGAVRRGGAVDQSGKIVSGPDNSAANHPHLPQGVELDPTTTEGKINNVIAFASSGVPIVSAFRAAPLATSASVAAGWGGSEVGEAAGDKVGGFAEAVGAPKGTRAVLRTGGAVAGGVVGGIKGAKVANAVRGAVAGPVAAEAVVAREVPSVQALQSVGNAARAEALAAGATAEQAQAKAMEAVTTAIREGATTGASTVLPAGKRAMATNLGGKARPGPAPTPPDQVESALRASLKKAEENVLKAPRIEAGAQRVGREVGMTKEEVRRATGPVLDEALGEASPLLPTNAYKSIAEKIKTIPRGEARDAYVKLANSSKAMWNVEAIRRTLETQGLVLPFAAVAGLVIQAEVSGSEGKERK